SIAGEVGVRPAYAFRLLGYVDRENAQDWLLKAEQAYSCPSNYLAMAEYYQEIKNWRNCPGTPRWCPGTPSERRSVGEFALEKLAFRSLARPQAAFCGTTWAVTVNLWSTQFSPLHSYTRSAKSILPITQRLVDVRAAKSLEDG